MSWGCSSVVERSLRMRDAPGSIPGVSMIFGLKKSGLVRELNPGPRAPEARIIPLDQRALVGATFEANQDRYGASLAQW